MVAALIEENKIRCKPPLPEEEVKGIAMSVARYKPNSDYAESVSIIRQKAVKVVRAIAKEADRAEDDERRGALLRHTANSLSNFGKQMGRLRRVLFGESVNMVGQL